MNPALRHFWVGLRISIPSITEQGKTITRCFARHSGKLKRGGNDHLMAHAGVGDFKSKCLTAFTGMDTPFHRHYLRWARAVHRDVQNKLAWAPGRVFHLWHGDMRHRRYQKNCERFRAFDFDPSSDV